MGKIYRSLGLLSTDEVHEVSRATLVGNYMGQTESRGLEAIEKASGGILFADEAHRLYREGKYFGPEALGVLNKEMEDRRGQLAVILAVYEDQMEWLRIPVPGLPSRISCEIHFESYDADQLVGIMKAMAED